MNPVRGLLETKIEELKRTVFKPTKNKLGNRFWYLEIVLGGRLFKDCQGDRRAKLPAKNPGRMIAKHEMKGK